MSSVIYLCTCTVSNLLVPSWPDSVRVSLVSPSHPPRSHRPPPRHRRRRNCARATGAALSQGSCPRGGRRTRSGRRRKTRFARCPSWTPPPPFPRSLRRRRRRVWRRTRGDGEPASCARSVRHRRTTPECETDVFLLFGHITPVVSASNNRNAGIDQPTTPRLRELARAARGGMITQRIISIQSNFC